MELTISFLLLVSVSALLIVKLLAIIQAYTTKWRLFGKLPGPEQAGYPPLGHAMLLRGDSGDVYDVLLHIINNIHKKGREVGCLWFGTVPVLIITGPEAVEVLLRSSEHMDKNFLYQFIEPWLGKGLLTSSGAKWKTRRRLLTPAFHFSILNEFLKSMNDQANVMTQKLDAHAETGKPFDISRNITLCALDIICETAMGESIHAQNDADSEYVKAVYRISELIQEREKAPWLWMDFVFNRTDYGKDFSKCLKVLHDFTNFVIKDRKTQYRKISQSRKKKRQAFLDLLLEVSKDGEVLSLDDIREEVDTFMFEGHDTTSSGMAWALHLIGSHPDVQKKIHDQLDEIFADDPTRDVAPEDLRKMDYLERVLKESLRMFPPVPLFGRTTTSDCRVDGCDVPAGTECMILVQGINRHKDYWTDPDKFDPERFNTENSVGRHPYAYIPFSAGPRNCIGQRFALMEEKVVLTHVFRKFKVESCDRTENIRQMSDLILRPRDGIKVKLTRR